MSLSGIVFYVFRALKLALPVTALLYGLRLLRKRGQPLSRHREFTVLACYLYLLSLVAITVIRDGKHLLDWWTVPHTAQTIQLIPITVTLLQGRAGAWYLIYPIAGNILWFVPLGVFGALLRENARWWQVGLGALLLSLGIEVVQWVLLSGISDIDDVIFNVFGGLLGFSLTRLLQKQHSR